MSNGVIITIVICATILIDNVITRVCNTISYVNAVKKIEEEEEDDKSKETDK